MVYNMGGVDDHLDSDLESAILDQFLLDPKFTDMLKAGDFDKHSYKKLARPLRFLQFHNREPLADEAKEATRQDKMRRMAELEILALDLDSHTQAS